MGNRRGKLDIPYLAIFSGVLIVAVIVSLILFPQWRESPATMVVLLVAAVGGVVGLAANFRSAFIRDKDDAPPAALDYDAPQHRRNQENVCANVRAAWIDGVLRESLPERVRLALALDSLPGMVQRQMVHVTGRTSRPEPVSEAHLADLFRASGRALLILGAPGSGKTVTLLELCRPILEGAEADPRRPVPVVLNLPTWAQKQAPLEEWIIDEMPRQYGLNRRVTPAWLAADHLILLLDGLDEVASYTRDACVRAINAFREEYGAGMVVCSRSADYAELSERLALSRAVEIRPLAPEQVDDYLSDERLGLAAVRQAIAQDDALRELATTPLMLNVMTVAYRGLPFDALLPLLNSQQERRAHLYDTYIGRVFAHRPLPDGEAGAAQALRRLRFLAQRLTERSETQFFIEDMQPDWLPGRRGPWVGVLGGMAATSDNIRLVSELAWDLSPRAIGRAVAYSVLGVGLGSGPVVVLFGSLFSWLGTVLGTVLGSGLGSELVGGLGGMLFGALVGGLAGMLVGGLAGMLVGGLVSRLVVVLFGGLLFDGVAVIKHYILRVLLSLHHLLPLRLTPFLEAMCERILIQRVGAHYRFIHRTLQEHVAALSDQRIEALTR